MLGGDVTSAQHNLQEVDSNFEEESGEATLLPQNWNNFLDLKILMQIKLC